MGENDAHGEDQATHEEDENVDLGQGALPPDVETVAKRARQGTLSLPIVLPHSLFSDVLFGMLL